MRFQMSAGLPPGGSTPSRRAVRFPTATAAAVATVGLAALAGWSLDVPVLRSGIPGLVEMKVNTAVAVGNRTARRVEIGRASCRERVLLGV